jgi:peptide/nickel transport system substrate-binding protein
VIRSSRWVGAFALLIAATLGLSACGGAGKGNSATVLLGTAPDSLDPQFSITTQGAEADWITYTPLVTYRHESGTAGSKLVPGLATTLPKISPDGLTYTLVLRKGLVYSNGQPVKASDFRFAVQRALKLNWGEKSSFTSYVVGAAAYDKGSAKTISGIKTDDAAGKVTIKLMQPFGAFVNVLAFPAAAPVPADTPLRNLGNHPPPGAGPYMITRVVPDRSFTLEQNPNWSKDNVPDVPAGHIKKITAQIVSNTQQEASQVLNNQADAFDPGDEIPPSLIGQIQSKAASRFQEVPLNQNFYFFLNTKTKPFNNQLAREAVNYGLDRRALQRLASGALTPACFFLPSGLIGHASGPCPYGGDPNGPPNVAKARQLIRQAGLSGAPVTVWGETRSPRKEYADYYTSVLSQIGLKPTEKLIASATYFQTIGNSKTPNVQTGFADWQQDYPNPVDFYINLLDAHAIQPVNNQNFSQVNDPFMQSELAALYKVPADRLPSAASRWAGLDKYVAKKAYELVYGYAQSPKFFSNRIDYASAVFHPLFFNDWTSWKLK